MAVGKLQTCLKQFSLLHENKQSNNFVWPASSSQTNSGNIEKCRLIHLGGPKQNLTLEFNLLICMQFSLRKLVEQPIFVLRIKKSGKSHILMFQSQYNVKSR
jgi:hypothetical protein